MPTPSSGSTSPANRAPFAPVSRIATAAELSAWEELCRRCDQGLADEREAIIASLRRWGGDQPLPVTGATFEGVEGETWIYTVRTPGQTIPPDYTSVEVLRGEAHLGRGVIEAVDPSSGELTIALEERCDSWDDVQLRFDSTALIDATRVRLEQVVAGQGVTLRAGGIEVAALVPAPVVASADASVEATVSTEPETGATPASSHEQGAPAAPTPDALDDLFEAQGNNRGQQTAVRQALAQPFHLTFGPPGTGKTSTLAVLARAAATRGEHVLLVAHTNTALDTAIRRVLDVWPEAQSAGGLVRLGKPTKQMRGLDLGPEGAVRRRRQQEEQDERATLDDVRQTLSSAAVHWAAHPVISKLWQGSQQGPMERRLGLLLAFTEELKRQGGLWADTAAPLQSVLDDVRQRREQAKAAVLAETPIIALTLSRLMMATRQELGTVDRIILDEASMAMLPQVLVASACTPRLSGFGDPRQLPPVVQAKTAAARTTVGCDLFTHLGLGLGQMETPDPRLTLLPTQYRMRPAIRHLVSKAFYDNQLEDAPSITEDEVSTGASRGPALWLIDTSDTPAVSERAGDSSRINNEHGAIVGALVAELEREGERDLGVITPFAAQARRLRSELQARRSAILRSGGIKTIHKAQGGEMDTVILDLVDAGPLRNASRFLDDRDTPELARLLCVALSRARQRLIIVAHTGIFREQSERRRGAKGLVLRLLGEAFRAGSYQRLSPQWRQQGRLLVPTDPTVAVSDQTVSERSDRRRGR